MKKYVLRFSRKIGLLKRVTLYPKTTLNSTRLRIPIINETGLDNFLNLSEPWMQHVLMQLLDEDKLFIDVGVNLGQTLLKVKAVNKNINYVGFEPNPLCVHYINELIKINSFPNTEIYPVGISNDSTVVRLKLFSNTDHDSAASIIEGFRDEASIKKSINVPVFNFSDLSIQNNLKIGIIKIDVEGAELEVLDGLKQRIKVDRPFILIEILPVYAEKNNSRLERQNQIQKILFDYECSIFRLKRMQNNFWDCQESKILEFILT